MRGVVAAALVDRPPVEQPRDVTSVVSRIGTARTRTGRISVATVVPATRQLDDEPERGEREPEHLAARVAHEDERAARGGG